MEMDPTAVNKDFLTLLSHGVKQGGLNIRNPVKGSKEMHAASTLAAKILMALLQEGTKLDLQHHQQCVQKAGAIARKLRADTATAFVTELKRSSPKAEKKRLERIGQCGAWLTQRLHRLNGNLLSKEEWRDNARLRYSLRPKGLCKRCDGCGAGFTVEHGLSCKKGGLVVQRHDDLRDEVGELAAMALTKARVSYEPEIFYGRGVNAGQQSEAERAAAEANLVAAASNVPQRRTNIAGNEARGDVAVHGFWKRGQTCILDVRVTDTDAKSYANSTSAKVLENAAKRKRDLYGEACFERRRSFAALVYLVDGMPCKEA
jgi:hypothetical protein